MGHLERERPQLLERMQSKSQRRSNSSTNSRQNKTTQPTTTIKSWRRKERRTTSTSRRKDRLRVAKRINERNPKCKSKKSSIEPNECKIKQSADTRAANGRSSKKSQERKGLRKNPKIQYNISNIPRQKAIWWSNWAWCLLHLRGRIPSWRRDKRDWM